MTGEQDPDSRDGSAADGQSAAAAGTTTARTLPVPDAEAATDTKSAPAAVRGVRVRCDGCGPRVVAPSAVRLLGRSDGWEYAVTCPGCGARIRRAADPALRAALRSIGAAELSVSQDPQTARDSGPGGVSGL